MSHILLDTNVLSELMRAQPATAVLAWFARQTEHTFFISSITQAEILLGIALLPAGRRKDALANAAEKMLAEEFAGYTLAFDEHSAAEYADIVATRTRDGQPISTEDAQIAAIARAHALPLATRNTKDFEGIAGLSILNPWEKNICLPPMSK